MELLSLVAGLVIFNLIATLWVMRQVIFAVENVVIELDAKMSAAIQRLLEGDLAGSIEPVNPIQAAIASFIAQKASEQPIAAQVIERAVDGKFSS